jgi:hypothetical protein
MNSSPALNSVERVLIELEYAVADFDHSKASIAEPLDFSYFERLLSKLMEASRAVQIAVSELKGQSPNECVDKRYLTRCIEQFGVSHKVAKASRYASSTLPFTSLSVSAIASMSLIAACRNARFLMLMKARINRAASRDGGWPRIDCSGRVSCNPASPFDRFGGAFGKKNVELTPRISVSFCSLSCTNALGPSLPVLHLLNRCPKGGRQLFGTHAKGDASSP